MLWSLLAMLCGMCACVNCAEQLRAVQNMYEGCGPSSLQHLTQLSCKALRTGIILTVISVPASTYSSSRMDAELCSSETSCTNMATKLSALVLAVTAPCTVRHHGMSQQGDVPVMKHQTPSRALTSPMLYGINTV